MKVDVSRAALADALTAVLPASKSAYTPVCNGVRLDAEGEQLHITCTDLDSIAIITIPAKVLAAGATIPPASLLAYMVGKASAEQCEIVTEDNDDSAHIEIGGFAADIACYRIKDWPRIPAEPSATTTLNADDVSRAIRASFAASPKDATSALRSLSFNGNIVESADHHRACQATMLATLPTMQPPAREAVVALKALGTGDIEVGFDGNYAMFRLPDGSACWRVRCLDAPFPHEALKSFYDLERQHSLTVERVAFIEAVQQVNAVFDTDHRPVRLTLVSDRLTLDTRSELGSSSATIEAGGSLPGVCIFGATKLLDALTVFTGEEFTMRLATDRKAALMEEDGIRQVLMPINPSVVK